MNQSTHMVFINMPFPARLAELRKQRGLTQEALSDLIGITKTQVYRYESGGSQPTLDVIRHLAIALGVTADRLIFDENERQPDESLALLMEGFARLDVDVDEKHIVRKLVEGILLKHEAMRLVQKAS